MKFQITTIQEIVRTYVVDASDREDAICKFSDNAELLDATYLDEDLDDVEEG